MCNGIGLIAIVPAAVLVSISFFVLVALRKIDTQGLKALGYFVTVLLWLAALIVFSVGISVVSGNYSPRMCMMQDMMKGRTQGMGGGGQMQGMSGQQGPGQDQGSRR